MSLTSAIFQTHHHQYWKTLVDNLCKYGTIRANTKEEARYSILSNSNKTTPNKISSSRITSTQGCLWLTTTTQPSSSSAKAKSVMATYRPLSRKATILLKKISRWVITVRSSSPPQTMGRTGVSNMGSSQSSRITNLTRRRLCDARSN